METLEGPLKVWALLLLTYSTQGLILPGPWAVEVKKEILSYGKLLVLKHFTIRHLGNLMQIFRGRKSAPNSLESSQKLKVVARRSQMGEQK